MLRRLAIALALLLVGAACTGDSPQTGIADTGGVRFLVFGEPEELKAYRNVIKAFRKAEPKIAVKLVTASDREDLLARLSTSFAGGTPPDLFLLNYRYYGQFAARGVLEPVEDRVRASKAFQEDDFYAQALDAFRFDGTLTCLPQNVSSLVVYYNRDMFKRANVSEPAPGWGWPEMVRKAVALTRDIDGDGVIDQYGHGVEPSLIRIAPFVWSNRGRLFDDDEHPTRFAFDNAARRALEDFFALHQSPYPVVPSDEEVEAEDDETRFQNGRTAMVLSSRRSTPTFRTITEFDWDVAPLPRHDERAGILHSDAYCMAAASDHKDEAWRFMEFALGREGQRITAASGRTVPSLIDVARSEAFLDPNAKPASSEVFLDTIPFIRRVPSVSTWPEIEDAAEPILERGFYEGVPTDEVIRQLTAATDEIFARAER
ncbi:MAG: sugar ABC transporter substrate-binding protein [Actinomycetota bacterium]|nr:sugar ABC transporter substrate-binding protein [Actinomycetota bacterium]